MNGASQPSSTHAVEAAHTRDAEASYRGLGVALIAAAITNALQYPYYRWWMDRAVAVLGTFGAMVVVPALVYGLIVLALGARRRFPRFPWLLLGMLLSYALHFYIVIAWQLSGD